MESLDGDSSLEVTWFDLSGVCGATVCFLMDNFSLIDRIHSLKIERKNTPIQEPTNTETKQKKRIDDINLRHVDMSRLQPIFKTIMV